MPTIIKVLHTLHALKVYKSIAHVAHCLGINLQIKKVKQVVKTLSDLIHQHVLSILVGNVLNHESGESAVNNLVWINILVRREGALGGCCLGAS